MFNRTGGFFVITTNNARALEAITIWIYHQEHVSKLRYFIQTETFPGLILYRVCIRLKDETMDKVFTKELTEELTAKHTELWESLE